MSNIRKRLHEQLEKRQQNGNFRYLKLTEGLIDFSSNDYLGLSRNRQLMSAVNHAFINSGSTMGSTGSRLLTGNSELHMELERRLAAFFEGSAALLFNSGYTANLALLSTIPQRGDTILYDQYIHACIKEGARLSKARYHSFLHNDPQDLNKKLRGSKGNKFVVIESLYSMEGDYPPLQEFIEICKHHQAELFIDEAHTTGWAGPNGKGWVVDQNLNEEFLARVYTFGKGFGVHGACVVGSKEVIEYLINFARPFIYTTALPEYSVISLDGVLRYLKNIPMPGEKLLKNINCYLEKAVELPYDRSLNRDSPVQWIIAGSNSKAVQFSSRLHEKGFDVRPILSPTVPEGRERLRVCVHAYNTEQQISDLLTLISHQA